MYAFLYMRAKCRCWKCRLAGAPSLNPPLCLPPADVRRSNMEAALSDDLERIQAATASEVDSSPELVVRVKVEGTADVEEVSVLSAEQNVHVTLHEALGSDGSLFQAAKNDDQLIFTSC